MKQIKSFLISILLLLEVIPTFAQIAWTQAVDSTYVFEISNKDAEKFLRGKIRDTNFVKILRKPLSTFVGEWKNSPKQGHFIFANISKNQVNYTYSPIIPFQVFLFKEYGVLTLQIIDENGTVRSDAKVRIRGAIFDKRVTFDKESQTYRIDDESQIKNRILLIELDKFKAVFDLTKFLVYPSYYSDDYGGNSPQFYSYMITDKNKYKPNETVRFKSYALNTYRIPIKKSLDLWLYSYDYRNYNNSYRPKKIISVEPYNPGGFAGEFQLHDSLKLRLDKEYDIELRDKWRIVAKTKFKYEDYELHDSKLEVALKTKQHFYPDSNEITIKATGANGLFLLDSKAKITIKRKEVLNSYTDILVLPNILLEKTVDLHPTEPTKFDIPCDLFAEADCEYEINVVVLTVDNQRLEQNHTATFYYSNHSVDFKTENDSIVFSYYDLGKEKNVVAQLFYNDEKNPKTIELPYKEKFLQNIKNYTIEIPEIAYQTIISTTTIPSKIDVLGGFVKDSFNVQIDNPLQLDVTWYIYQGNQLLEKAAGKDLDFTSDNVALDVTYYVEIFYFMGDKEQVFRRIFAPKPEYLSLDVDLPDRIFPGQQVDATVSVTDNFGQPVPKVDLTAFAVNSQLNYFVPDLPYYGASPSTREQRNSYAIKKKGRGIYLPLDYKFWKNIAHLDSLPYYQFIYPWDTIFTYAVSTPDSTTQFAPYIMKDGKAIDIYVIEANGTPVYFSWTEQPKTYSFNVSDGKNNIILRLHDRTVMLNSIYFEKGKKTIVSIDIDYLPEAVRVLKFDKKDSIGRYVFENYEAERYKKLIACFPVPKGQDFVYLKQENHFYPIHHLCFDGKLSVLAGPIPQGLSQYANGVEYRHEGGFSYQFEDNVVYKYPQNVLPEYLKFSTNNNFSKLNDFSLNINDLNQKLIDCKRENWQPQSISIAQNNMSLMFRLPVEKDSTGVSNLFLIDKETGNIVFPNIKYGKRFYPTIEHGLYDVILIYNNDKYLEYKEIAIKKDAYTEVNMSKLPLNEADSISQSLLNFYQLAISNKRYNSANERTMIFRSKNVIQPENAVSGIIYADEDGLPIPGVSIVIEGTRPFLGTVSDIDGYFEIELPNKSATLLISCIGYEMRRIVVYQGGSISVKMQMSSTDLDAVVITGYGVQRRVASVGSAAVITNLSGTVPGVQIETGTSHKEVMIRGMASISSSSSVSSLTLDISSENFDENKAEKAEAEAQLYAELLQLNGLRSNFSDVGFWQPKLFTDNKGEAKFSVTFPDNITKWEAVVYAMNRHLQTGTWRKSIKSYKPLMAELKTPQFLVANDSAYFVGNITNYTKDSTIAGNILFTVENDTLLNKNINFEFAHKDKMWVVPTLTDSITSTYLFTRDDGYSDGERRGIPIIPQGTEMAKGTLGFMHNGDTLTVSAKENETIQLAFVARPLDIYLDATNYLTGYRYACNEQLASKLIGLLSYKMYQNYLGNTFRNDRNVNEIISRLLANQNDKKLWSWWGRSSAISYWMSAHILRALKMAKDAGYEVKLDLSKIGEEYADIAHYKGVSLNDIEIIHALSSWGAEQNYEQAVDIFENIIKKLDFQNDSIAKIFYMKSNISYLKEKLLLAEIRQQQNLNYQSDSIAKYLKKDVVGAVYFDDNLPHSWYSDKLLNTLIAYRIIKNDSALAQHKEAMQMYILGTKNRGWNTYHAASSVASILPDLLDETPTKDALASVILSGDKAETITKFPYETVVQPNQSVRVEKQSGVPIIFTSYTKELITQKQPSEAFSISTNWTFNKIDKIPNDILSAGKPVTLAVTVEVKEPNAEHIMIEIPIPASCSYASKQQFGNRYNNETYREYFKEKTVIFCEKLSVGTYRFYVELLPRYTGKYTLNPAKVELMYLPVVNANNDLRKVSFAITL